MAQPFSMSSGIESGHFTRPRHFASCQPFWVKYIEWLPLMLATYFFVVVDFAAVTSTLKKSW